MREENIRKWKLTRRWTVAEAQKLDWKDIAEMSMPERADLANFYYTTFRRRLNTAKKAGIMPYAIKKLQDDFDKIYSEEIELSNGEKITMKDFLGFDLETPIVTQKKGQRMLNPKLQKIEYANNTLLGFLAMMKEYFSWQTGTVGGWNKFTKKQDIMLFGKDEKGRPNYRMSDEERTKFWHVYNELRKRGMTMVQDSETLIQSGLTILWQEEHFSSMDMIDIVKMLEKMDLGNLSNIIQYPEISEGNQDNPFQQKDVFGRKFDNDDTI